MSREAVRQWYTTWERVGVRGLRSRPKPGPQAKLSAAEWRRVAVLLRYLERPLKALGHR